MAKVLTIILGVIFITSCNQVRQDQNDNSIVNQRINNTCINPEFLRCIKEYIHTHEYFFMDFIDTQNIFYQAYFFEKGDNNYFTILTFTSIPLGLDTNIYYFLGYKLMDRSVVLIVNKAKPTKLVQISINSLFEGLKMKEKRTDQFIDYDGSWYPETYTYFNDNGRIVIEKLDTLFEDVLGKDFVEFEKRFETTTNGYRKLIRME